MKSIVKMAFLAALSTVLILWSAMPLSAEIYQYRDASGVLHFTDNILDVPPAQRPMVNATAEIVSPKPETRPDDPVGEDMETPDERPRAYRQLLEEQNSLDQLFLDLEAQKIALNKEREKISSREQLQEYRKKIENFNRQVKAFTERRESFVQKTRAFNQTSQSSSP